MAIMKIIKRIRTLIVITIIILIKLKQKITI